MTVVWIYIDERRARPWCALSRAQPGGRIVTLCAELPYQVLPLSTDEPDGLCCSACLSRLPGRDTAVAAVDAVAVSRAQTLDLRGDRPAVDPVAAWERPEWDPPSAELPMEDIR